MTNTTGIAKQLVAGILLAAAALSPVRAQETPPPPVEFLEPGLVDEPATKKYLLGDSLQDSFQAAGLELWDSCPAPPESSGTWLRRGWWSAEVDAVVMIRKWDRQGALLASDASTSSNPTFGLAGRTLSIGRTSPSEGSARLNLGRFLFRDVDNRDHTMEFTVFGGGEFLDSCHLDSDVANAIFVGSNIDNSASTTFSGASSMDVTYASRLNSFELNYKVTSRMKRDRMELQPDGRWIRRASPGTTYHAIAGMRYIDLTEDVIWTADDIANNVITGGESGLYQVEAKNDLFGFQVGGGMSYEADRWSVTFFSKGGIFMNDAKSKSLLQFTDEVTGDPLADVGFANSDRDGSLPLVLQGGFIGRYHLRPNVSVRAGYEFLYMTAMAMGPHQLNFTPEDGKIHPTATPFYHGITMGGEFYW